MRIRRSRSGAAAIEFALILPVFCAIMFGIIEYGWVFFQQANIIASVRDGTRYAVTLPQDGSPTPDEAAVARVRAELLSLGFTEGDLEDADIEATYSGSTPYETLEVSAAIPYTSLTGFFPESAIPGKITASMTMLLELQD